MKKLIALLLAVLMLATLIPASFADDGEVFSNALFSLTIPAEYAGLYEVEVKEDLRNKGFGTKYMLSLMNSFKDMTLFLQVGSKNVAAVKLYRKLGFEVTEEVCYYKMS